jgi:hypothetical protein
MLFFYVLVEGCTWNIASKLATNSYAHKSTIYRRYIKWLDGGIFKQTYDEILNKYLTDRTIDEVHIDSTDIQNKNMSTKHTYKSFKLGKQALRLTVLGDNLRAPIDYRIDKALKPDSVLGYNILINTRLRFKTNTFVFGDKGYQMKDVKRKNILDINKLRIVVPKRRYKKKNQYKTKNYKSKRKIIRHSRRMKEGLSRRIVIEHINSNLHRSYKRIDKVHDKSIKTFDGFVKLTCSMILINKL